MEKELPRSAYALPVAGTREMSFAEVIKRTEDLLIEEGYLTGTSKEDYVRLVRLPDSSREEIIRFLKTRLSPEEREYLLSPKLQLALLSCMRRAYFESRGRIRRFAERYISAVDTLITGKEPPEAVWRRLIDHTSEADFKDPRIRASVLYLIIFSLLHSDRV